MRVKWLGHACFLITADNGLKIVTDPYEASPGGRISYGPVREAPDIVTISHQDAAHSYTADLMGNPEIVRGAGSHMARGIEFVCVPTPHGPVPAGEPGENAIFSFAIDGISVCHCGDLDLPLSEAAHRALEQADVLLMPTGGPPGALGLEEAIALWEKLQPAVVIPMHFRNQKCSFPSCGVEDLVRLRPGTVLAGSSEAELIAGHLPEGRILVLEPAL